MTILSKESLSKEALLIQSQLKSNKLETPLKRLALSDQEKKSKIAWHFGEIMKLIGLDLGDDSLVDTPNRVAKMYIDEIFSGLNYEKFPKITLIDNKMEFNGVVTVRDIVLTSMCEHHFLTIDGHATVAYIPNQYIIGLSKVNRIVNFLSERPQVQERLTQQILVTLQTLLQTNDVAVLIDAVHYCVRARGIQDAKSVTTTTAFGGLFKTDMTIRQELLQSLK